tara:strand:+ start:7626 stop:8159 length:534 start_codon:yes stop_codon:yes gene_type:complete
MAKYWVANNPNSEVTDTKAQKLAELSATTISVAELNALDASNTEPADGPFSLSRWAKAEYDFAVDGGAISAINLGVTIPDNAIIVGGFIEVITTCTTASGDAGTMAIHLQSADDIVAAIAVSNGANPWDAGIKDIVPDATGSTAIKLTAARAVTATIAGQAFESGKFNVWLNYVIGE